MIKKILLSCITCLCCIPLFAQWTLLNSNTNLTLKSVWFLNPDTGFVCGQGGTLLKTTDGGANWNSLTPGSGFNFNELYFLNNDTGFCVGDSAIILKTTNGGTSWSVFFAPYNDCTLNSVFFVDANTGFAGGSKDVINGLILKTTDGGSTWNEMTIDPYFLDEKFESIKMTSPDTGYACTRGLLYKTINAGLNWNITDTPSVNSGNLFSIFEDMHFFSSDSGVAVGWYNPMFASTSNGGSHWNTNSAWQLTCIDFSSPDTGYMAGWSYVYKTTNHGASWTDVTGTANFLQHDIDFVNGQIGYVVGDNGTIMKTVNGATGISSAVDHHSIQVYPNPANSELNIDLLPGSFQTCHAKLMNLAGAVVLDKSITELHCRVDLNAVPAGIYVLEIHSTDVFSHWKIAVTH